MGIRGDFPLVIGNYELKTLLNKGYGYGHGRISLTLYSGGEILKEEPKIGITESMRALVLEDCMLSCGDHTCSEERRRVRNRGFSQSCSGKPCCIRLHILVL